MDMMGSFFRNRRFYRRHTIQNDFATRVRSLLHANGSRDEQQIGLRGLAGIVDAFRSSKQPSETATGGSHGSAGLVICSDYLYPDFFHLALFYMRGAHTFVADEKPCAKCPDRHSPPLPTNLR